MTLSSTVVSRLDRVRAEQTRTQFRNCPIGVIGSGTAALLLALAFAWSGRASAVHAGVWSAAMVGCVVAHLALCWLYWRVRPSDLAWRLWLGAFTVIALIEGLTWALGAVWMTSPTDLTQELIVILVSSVMASGAVPVFGAYFPTYCAYFFPTIIPHLGFFLIYGYPGADMLAALTVAYLVAMPMIAWRTSRQLTEGLSLRFENQDLVEDLRRQKQIAETANLAKSSFLAAASHDLRQPVHALGLFIGALRQRRMDLVARDLVDNISQSVTSLDDLFASLLDISKLDAGIVEPQLEPVSVNLLLERLCREYEGEAAAKGVTLRRVSCSAVAHSDGVLLERILRNLLANAVRYTDTGKILVGCRRRSNDLTLEVWDTGSGVAPAEAGRIFDEFYQVGNPERDRAKGLGLGLAIVRRLAVLLDSQVTLASQPGSGSVFRLTVARLTGVAANPAASDVVPVSTRSSARILVIDDEIQIQRATAALLTSWGHHVVTAGDVPEALALSEDQPPDLIICDYRLRGGETGIGAIEALRAHYRRDIAAMLITGDTAPARLAEAHAGGLLLLHKPLPNAKLRAAVGNLLRTKAV